jgi:hypothetical protein
MGLKEWGLTLVVGGCSTFGWGGQMYLVVMSWEGGRAPGG